ncbi:MAG: glycerol kinase GlpK [Candidatus Carbobacillus altaicus]|nr:glycerol kinase GlpK [Candidatus Carbobacillus altaicus]
MSNILAIDQGTTSTRVMIFSEKGKVVAKAHKPLSQHYPQPGWVEHDATEIWHHTQQTIREAMSIAGLEAKEIAAIGITNQRETTVLWEKESGEPIHRAIVWQDRRTAGQIEAMREEGWAEAVREKTGLELDAYFSASKLSWLLDHIPQARSRAERGEILFGTIDSYLMYRLTGGTVHATDVTNASRTMLYNIQKGTWDDDLIRYFNIPRAVLPDILPSSGLFGYAVKELFSGQRIPIQGVAGDQQAALFGQGAWESGMVKNTYGTGCFMLMPTGHTPVFSKRGLLTTIAWDLGDGPVYALEGSVFVAGAAIQWLRDGLGLIERAEESEMLAATVPDTGGVVVVPAFVGLGAPHWDMYARGTIVGLTRGTGKAHIVRAVLESLAYQTKDVLSVMAEEAGSPLKLLKVDGGAANNNWLMQFQADILGVAVSRPHELETTAYGAAAFAALAAGVWSRQDILDFHTEAARFLPQMPETERRLLYARWLRAVERAKQWVVVDDEATGTR